MKLKFTEVEALNLTDDRNWPQKSEGDVHRSCSSQKIEVEVYRGHEVLNLSEIRR